MKFQPHGNRQALTSLPYIMAMLMATATAAQPNILMIVVDDLGAHDLGCYGSTFHETPEIDKLAQRSILFTRAYTAYPRCVPARFALLTGKHPTAFQRDKDSVKVEPTRDTTIGQAFTQAGYQSFYAGKWHLGEGASHPSKVGFTTTIAAGAAGATRSHFAPYTESRGKGGKESSGGGSEEDKDKAAIEGLEEAPRDESLTERLTAETSNFIQANQKKPFCAVLAHYAVHTPLQAKTADKQHFEEKLAKLPKNKGTGYEPESAGENLLFQQNATYAGMLKEVDTGVGKLVAQLTKLGLLENTVIIITSDHGGLSARGNSREVATSNRPLRAGKGHLYEGGLRVPLLVHFPEQIQKSVKVGLPVSLLDVFPTLLELAKLPPPASTKLDGTSFANLLTGSSGNKLQLSRALFWHNPAPRPNSTADFFSSALLHPPYKLVHFPGENRTELYNLTLDVGERTDLSSKEPKIVEHYMEMLHAWREEVGASTEARGRRKDSEKAP